MGETPSPIMHSLMPKCHMGEATQCFLIYSMLPTWHLVVVNSFNLMAQCCLKASQCLLSFLKAMHSMMHNPIVAL